MERVALYCRVSSEEQSRHGLSLNEQAHSLRQYAKDHKMQVVDCYIDAGISARKKYTNRPALLRLLSDIEADKIDTVLFIKLDRWTRNVAAYYELQKVLDDHNVKWIATQEDYETVTASGRFKVNIMLSVAQDEADRTSERLRFVQDGKRERNEPTNGHVPKGYKVVDKQVELDDKLAPQVRAAFEMYWKTGSTISIIDSFPDLKLNKYSARRMLSHHGYTGDFAGISIPPIISQAEYDKTQDMKAKHIRKAQHNRVYLFTGLVICSNCGHRMSAHSASHPSKKRGGIYLQYYACPYHLSKCGCSNAKWTREDLIEGYLLTHIDSRVAQITATKKSTARSYKKERDAVQKKISKLQDLYIEELIDKEDYKKRYERLSEELSSIPPDEPEVDVCNLKRTFTADWKDLYNDLPTEGKQLFWRRVLESVTVCGNTVIDFSLSKNAT